MYLKSIQCVKVFGKNNFKQTGLIFILSVFFVFLIKPYAFKYEQKAELAKTQYIVNNSYSQHWYDLVS